MGTEPVKICPRCRAEYELWAEVCSDCRVPLVLPGAAAAEMASPTSSSGLSETDVLACLRVGDARYLRGISEELQAAGIPCRIDAYPPRAQAQSSTAAPVARLGLYVRRADLEAASRVDHEHHVRSAPDVPAEVAGVGEVHEACPACGAALQPGATRCDSCELEFPVLSYPCGSCGALVTGEDGRCRSCGAALSPGKPPT